MTQIGRPSVRLKCDPTAWNGIVDKRTQKSPIVPRGTDVDIQLGLYTGDVWVDDVSDIGSITVALKDNSNRAGVPYITETIESADVSVPAGGESDWTDDADQHAAVTLTDEDTNLPAAQYWLVVSIIRTNGDQVTIGAGVLEIREDGDTGSTASGGLTVAQGDARYLQRGHAQASWRVQTEGGDQFLQLYNPTTAKWHTFYPDGDEGSVLTVWGPGED